MNTKSITRLAAVATMTAGLALGATVPAMASHGGDRGVEKSGSCSQGARWDFKAKHDDGRLEVELEVDTDRSGQTFAWRVTDQGKVAAKGKSTTKGASGSFSVERRIADLPGTDVVRFTAKNAANGETCMGLLRV